LFGSNAAGGAIGSAQVRLENRLAAIKARLPPVAWPGLGEED
jgi:hypothetical protein